MPTSPAILVVRLGAMGDIIHTLPAVAALKRGHPESPLVWAVEPKWEPLLEQNPFVDRIVLLHRESLAGLMDTRRSLRENSYELAVDFQGLIKSGLVAFAASAERTFGFDAREIRERAAAIFYRQKISSRSVHVVERNLDLALAAGGVPPQPPVFPLPPGRPEGDLPSGDFVLASPLAGWASKQWPLPHYRALAVRLSRELGMPLVLNGVPGAAFGPIDPAVVHGSSLPGLIHATRRAAAVVGVDSGPLHLAAALEKPGVAIFGPTDPARNGPYGHSIRVLRRADAATTYKRGEVIDLSMRDISPDEVFEALRAALGERSHSAGCLAG
jgi:heptosyltransferase-1